MRQIVSPHWLSRVVALVMLYVFFGHPGIYADLWKQEKWLAMAAAVFTLPIATVECLRILIVRVSIDEEGFSLRSLVGVKRARFDEIKSIERSHGKIAVWCQDGSVVRIPWLVGNLDRLALLLQSRGAV